MFNIIFNWAVRLIAKQPITRGLKVMQGGAVALFDRILAKNEYTIPQEERIDEVYWRNRVMYLWSIITSPTIMVGCAVIFAIVAGIAIYFAEPVISNNKVVIANALIAIVELLIWPVVIAFNPLAPIKAMDPLVVYDWIADICFEAVANYPMSIFFALVIGVAGSYFKGKKVKSIFADLKEVILHHKKDAAFCAYLLGLLWLCAFCMSKACAFQLSGGDDAMIGAAVLAGFLVGAFSIASILLYSKLVYGNKSCINKNT